MNYFPIRTDCIVVVFSGLILLFLAAVTLAQEVEDTHEAPAPVTTGNPDITLEELNFRLKPLTKEELKVEADGWIGVLKEQINQISEQQIKALSAEGDNKDKILESVNKLQEQRTRLIDRVNAVIKAYRDKGGEVDDYEKYVSAVSGVDVDVSDVGGAWQVVTGWLFSAEGGIRWLQNILLFAVTILVFSLLARLAGGAMQKAVEKARRVSSLLKDFLVNVVRKLVFFIGIVVALSMLEVNIGPFLAAIGAVGFIVGFALQGTLSNFASGIMILLYRPYDIGDFVNVAGTSGTVNAMSLVSTTLKLPDNQVVVIPNNSIWGGVITNVTGSATRRVDMVFGIGYDDDIDKAQRILQDIVMNHPAVLKEPAPVIKVHELADSAVNFVVRPWTNTADYFTVYCDITRAVKQRFDAEGISIPYPQQDVHMYQATA